MQTFLTLDKDTAAIASLKELVDAASRVVITCHLSPDGDAIGSTLALSHTLEAMGKRPAVITPDVPTETLMFLPGARQIIPASRFTERAMVHIQAADLIVCLDFNALHRIDRLAPLITAATAPKVLIDHHLGPEKFADVIISHPEASSTCYLLYEIIKRAGGQRYMGRKAAECIYTGMMTDTGNFSYNSNDPQLYRCIAELLGYGIDKDRLYKLAFDTTTADRLRLNGFAVAERMTLYPEHRCAVIALSRSDLQRFNYQKGDTEGLVNQPLGIPEVTWVCFLRQDDEKFVKLSFRSKGRFPVNKICQEQFGGGGHLNAAGGELDCTLDEAVSRLEAVMPLYDNYLKNQ